MIVATPQFVISMCMVTIFVAAPGSTVRGENRRPDVKNGSPTLFGLNGLSVNGQIHSHGQPTNWFVKYGPTAELGKQTDSKSIPPKLAAFYRESWDEGWNGWNSWCPKRIHVAEGGQRGGYISYEGSSKNDHNHDDGVGTVHLGPYLNHGSMSFFDNDPAAYLAGGDPDFRDARVKISVRGRNWKPNGTELMWWSQAQSNFEVNPDDRTLGPNYLHANWVYTGKQLTDLLATGKWETAEYRLLNDTNLWSYCGSNRPEMHYMAYWSINDTQQHLNLDLFQMVVFLDLKNPPTGAIDFDEFEVAYHNYSLVYATNGGKLISSPKSDDDPERLTDGWRHGPERMWKSAANPNRPQEFVYEFAIPVKIDKVQLHQHTEWPAKEVEVLVSEDGSRWRPIIYGEVPEQHPHGPNFNFLLKKKLSENAKFVKVRILSGYKTEHWGLGEVEVFGDGAKYLPDDDWFHANLDLLELKPGEVVNYRFVATNSNGATEGPLQLFKMPADTRPEVVTGAASRIGRITAKVEGRLNPLGKKTEFHFEFGPTKDYGEKTARRYGGLQITPRLAFDTLTNLKPDTTYHYRLVATNETGMTVGADRTFQTK